MRFPLHITTDMIKWQLKNKLRGQSRYPVVLMLEPLYTCNLACVGCTPERHQGDLKDRLSLDQCFESVDQSGAPVVSICGGEPTVYPELPELVEGIIGRKRHIYLCTNGILLERFYAKGKPHKRLSINVHLDGMRDTHDFVCDKPGVFDKAVEMIKLGKQLGYSMCTNTTVFRETSMEEIEEMCEMLTELGVDGIMISPGYHYEALKTNHFLYRNEIHQKVQTGAETVRALQDLAHPAVPRIRRWRARLSLYAMGQCHPDALWLEGPVLPHRQAILQDLGRVLERGGLGLLGKT